MIVIIKALALSILFFSAAGLASADYADAMRHYERQEYREALEAFDEAAMSGDADAQYMLGRLYEAGNGTAQDFVEAHQWYNLAAARGHGHAAEARDTLSERMTAEQVARAQQAASDWQADDASQQADSSSDASASRPPIETLSDREGITAIQRELNRLGYDAGPGDGVMGSRTRSAIRSYQADMDLARNGRASAELFERLRQTERDDVAKPAEPPTLAAARVALDDDFRDGDFRHNPPWRVLSGEFEVDDDGLRSVVDVPQAAQRENRRLSSDRPEEIGLAMLELVLQQTGNARQPEQKRAPVEPARSFVDAPVDNAFRLEADIASRQSSGSLALGVFQGARPAGTGYRLVYPPRPGLSLVRLIDGRAEMVARHDSRVDLEDGRFHRIVWTRGDDGEMQVRVDDRRLLRVTDNGLRDPFQGVVMANQGGDYTLGRIRLEE